MKPVVSVVMVTWNSGDVLEPCLRSVIRSFDGLDAGARLVVVDNGSIDGSVSVAERVCPRARVIRNTRNVGFAAACNQGIAATDTPFVAMLNPDTLVEPPWLNYGLHKLLAEQYVQWSGIDHAIARPSNVYGPNQPAGGEGAVIAAFVSAAQHSSPLVVHGDGTQSRDFLHVADLVSALLLLGDCDDTGTWNVSLGGATSVIELAQLLEQITGRPLEITDGNRRPGDVDESQLANDRIRQLGWSPRVSLADGLRQMLKPQDGNG